MNRSLLAFALLFVNSCLVADDANAQQQLGSDIPFKKDLQVNVWEILRAIALSGVAVAVVALVVRNRVAGIGGSKKYIQVVDAKKIANKTSVCVIRVHDREYILGICDNGIQTIDSFGIQGGGCVQGETGSP